MSRKVDVEGLKKLIEEDPEWEKYIESNSAELIEKLIEFGTIKQTSEFFNLDYQSVRGKIERSIKRIKEKNQNGLRGGQSQKAKKLKRLLELTSEEELKKILTENEYKFTKKYLECENFNEVARTFDISPSNVMITLYGSKNRAGVIGKLEKQF